MADDKVQGVQTLSFDSLTLDDNESPLVFSPARRWTCMILGNWTISTPISPASTDVEVAAMTASIAFCSSIHTAAISSVDQSFACSRNVSTLGVTTFLLGFGSGPLIFAPLSKVFGRNPVYRVTLFLFLLFDLGCALSPNIAALLAFRFLCGFSGSPTGWRFPLTMIRYGDSRKILSAELAPSKNSDQLQGLAHRHPAVQPSFSPARSVTATSFLGPVLAPIVGAFICQYTSWRWCYWVVLMFSATVYVCMFAFLPETYPPRLSQLKAQRLVRVLAPAAGDYALKGQEKVWGNIRTSFRKLGDGSEAIQGWLGLLPSESDDLSVVCGSLKLILKASYQMRKVADKVLSGLIRIQAILSSVQRVLKLYPTSTKLIELSDAIYQSALVALGRTLEYLKRKACRKIMAALVKQESFESELEKEIQDVAAARDLFNEEAEMCHKEELQKLQDATARSKDQVHDARLHLQRVVEMGIKEQERSNRMAQEVVDFVPGFMSAVKSLSCRYICQSGDFDDFAANARVFSYPVKRLPDIDGSIGLDPQRRPSLLGRIHKPMVRPGQARKILLRRLDYDPDVAAQDVVSNYRIGPTLTKDEQERCLYTIRPRSYTQWMQSKGSSVLVINANGGCIAQRKSGLSFLCARLVYSLDLIRFGGKPGSGTIARPEIVPIHFFCGQHLHNDRSESWESPSGIANSLLAQLVSQHRDIDVSRLKLSQYSGLDESSVGEVLDIFRLLIKELLPHFVVFCIVDGLSFYANNDSVSKSTRLLVGGLLKVSKTSKKASKSHGVADGAVETPHG